MHVYVRFHVAQAVICDSNSHPMITAHTDEAAQHVIKLFMNATENGMLHLLGEDDKGVVIERINGIYTVMMCK